LSLKSLPLATKVSLVSAATCLAVVVINLLIQFSVGRPAEAALSHPSIWLVAVFGLMFGVSILLPRRLLEALQTALFLVMADATALLLGQTFALLVFFAVGLGLLHRYDLFPRHRRARLAVALAQLFPFLLYNTLRTEGSPAFALQSLNYLVLLLSSLILVYLVFEEQLRQALASQSQQSAELEATRRELSRLEPLSALGENLSHVTHSFKNQLNQLTLARVLLDQGAGREEVSALLSGLTSTLNDRVENLLMVSRAGFDREPEIFDAARVLRGVEEVFVHVHPGSDQVVRHRPEPGPVLLKAIRGDFVLLAENLLKNAYEAVTAREGAGMILVELGPESLTVANDGGAMEHCEGCEEDCGRCPRYGRPGQTTKPGGSGHGLAQLGAACRRAGWTWRVTSAGDWTRFEIRFRTPG